MSTTQTSEVQRPIALDGPEFAALVAEIGRESADRERDGIAPFEQVELLRAARFGSSRIPVAEGGAGASVRELFTALLALGAADSNLAHAFRAHLWFVEARLERDTPRQRSRWFEQMARGRIFGNATSELGALPIGGDQFATKITPARGGGFRLNGTKYYSTGTLYSDLVSVYVSTEDGGTAKAVVPVDRAGVTVEDDWDGFGQTLTGTGTTRFDDVEVRDDEVLDRVAKGDDAIPTTQTPFLQLLVTALIAANVRAAADDAAALLRRRKRSFTHASSEQPTHDPQLLQLVGELESTAFATEQIVLAAADTIDRANASAPAAGSPPDEALALLAARHAAQAKVVVDELAIAATAKLFDVGGASATRRGVNLDRHWRNVRTLTTHNPRVSKARALGDLVVNGEALPQNGFF